MKIVLIGFMGAGKSVVAKALGDQLNFPVLEMDELACQKNQVESMYALFAKGGELLLRETEIEIAKSYRSEANLVISTGGGVVMNKIILDYLKENLGKVFFLNAGFDLILQRLAEDDSRPLFKNLAQAKALYDFRLPLYERYADEAISVDGKSVEDIVEEMVSVLNHTV